MLRYKILHRTYYNYSAPVELGLHYLRLRPRENHEQRVESSRLEITPLASLLWNRDVEGNSVAIASFDRAVSQLHIESEAIIDQYNEDPLEFMVADYAIQYPFGYSRDDTVLLSPYLLAHPVPASCPRLMQWLGEFWKQGERIQTYTLLDQLCAHIHRSLTYCVREEPGVQSPMQTLELGTGSCRDFATLFMQAARCLGLAARFVSGYLYVPPPQTDAGATHAWAEVYLPGAGWRGFDPTSGKMAGADHIAVAVARLPESVPPVSGSFTGTAESSMQVGVWVSRL